MSAMYNIYTDVFFLNEHDIATSIDSLRHLLRHNVFTFVNHDRKLLMC